MGDAQDVAHSALFLASDEARYITGIDLVVDGGLTVNCVSEVDAFSYWRSRQPRNSPPQTG